MVSRWIVIPIIGIAAAGVIIWKFAIQPFKAGAFAQGQVSWTPMVLGAPLSINIGSGVYASTGPTGRYGRY